MALMIFVTFGCSRPIADFVINKSHDQAPVIANLVNVSQNAEKYLWSFGDGTTSEAESPSHRYVHSGRYTISLAAQKGKKVHAVKKDIFIEAPTACLVEISTSLGNITLQLFDNTPLHRDNFLRLVEVNYYENLLFHRVMRGFMVQAGDPDSRNASADQRLGGGGPGYTIPAEFIQGNYHVKGALAAARTPDEVNPQKQSSGSQFYIVHGSEVKQDQLDILARQKRIVYQKSDIDQYLSAGGAPQLDNEYTVFGKVIAGIDIIDKIAASVVDANNRPHMDVKILNISLIK